jgi:hypothetical protein
MLMNRLVLDLQILANFSLYLLWFPFMKLNLLRFLLCKKKIQFFYRICSMMMSKLVLIEMKIFNMFESIKMLLM